MKTAALIIGLFAAASLYGQPARTFVASTGSDANPCSRALPCRSFAAAVAAVGTGGDVVVLDSAGYGPVTITKSISIVAPAGVYAGVTATSGNAITISDTTATVTLKGLTIDGLQSAEMGILGAGMRVLHVENCEIAGFNGYALDVTGSGQVFVADSVARDNGSGGFVFAPLAGMVVTGFVTRCRAENNGVAGFEIVGSVSGSRIGVRDSIAINHPGSGFDAEVAEMTAKNCSSVGNGYGFSVANGGIIAFAGSTVADNDQYGLANGGGVLLSFGTNDVSGNGHSNQSLGTVTTGALQ